MTNPAGRGKGAGRAGGLRITGGALRGRRIAVPAGCAVRPMRSRVRLALFDMLGDAMRAARVADVFAGSGALGMEALSRGAAVAIFVERDPRVLATLERNLSGLGLMRRAQIVRADAYTHRLRAELPFDFVFLDPPFADYGSEAPRIWTLAADIAGGRSLVAAGCLCLEVPAALTPPPPPEGVEIRCLRRYGDTALLIWGRRNFPDAARDP